MEVKPPIQGEITSGWDQNPLCPPSMNVKNLHSSTIPYLAFKPGSPLKLIVKKMSSADLNLQISVAQLCDALNRNS